MEDVEKAEHTETNGNQSVDELGTSSKDRIIEVDGSVDVQVPVIEPQIEPAAPPYTLLGKVKAARQEAGDDWKVFIFQFVIILFSSVYAIIFLAISVVIPVSMIAIGSIYVNDCPRERYIPIYLIVGGCFGAFSQLLRIIRQTIQRKDETQDAKPHPLEGILTCFLVAWFIAGNVWVYRTFGHFTTDSPSATDYCHPTVYWFAFWLITSTYILVAVGCCGICLCGVCVVFACRSVGN